MRLNINHLRNDSVFFCSNSILNYYQIVLQNIFARDKSYCVEVSRSLCKPSNSAILEFPTEQNVTAIIPDHEPILVLLLARRNVVGENVVCLLVFCEREIIIDWYDLKVLPQKIKESFSSRRLIKGLSCTEHGIHIVNLNLISYESNRKRNTSCKRELQEYLSQHNWLDIGAVPVNDIIRLSTLHKRKLASSLEASIPVCQDAHGQTGYAGEIPNSIVVDQSSRKYLAAAMSCYHNPFILLLHL